MSLSEYVTVDCFRFLSLSSPRFLSMVDFRFFRVSLRVCLLDAWFFDWLEIVSLLGGNSLD